VRIENWSIGFAQQDPYKAPELHSPRLSGNVYGHPKFDDGTFITTSTVTGNGDGCLFTRTGSRYDLGDPHPDYEAAYPNAKQRALARPPGAAFRASVSRGHGA
jgi:hypothetical protein